VKLAFLKFRQMCSLISESANRGHLCSASHGDLVVPRSRTTRYGERCFAVFGPILWNLLPSSARYPHLTQTQFCALLKTVLFCRAFKTLTLRLSDSLGCEDCCTNTNSLTYLLMCLFRMVAGRECIPGPVFSFPGIGNVQASFPGFPGARE